MAEERLIDDDKDRKYKIRINADGEEELVIDESAEQEGESEIPVFEIPADGEDDEEAALLTPEQLAERERLKLEEQTKRKDAAEALYAKTVKSFEEGDFEAALYAVNRALELTPDDGRLWFYKLKTVSRNLTEFNSPESCAEAAAGVAEFCTAEQKAELKTLSAELEARLAQAKTRTAELGKQNEAGKAERRDEFARMRKKSLIGLLCTGLPFIALTIAAVVFATMIFANEQGVFVIATAVAGGLAAIMLAVTAIAANKFWAAQRYVVLNERDNTTKIGRQYLESKSEADNLTRVLQAIEQ